MLLRLWPSCATRIKKCRKSLSRSPRDSCEATMTRKHAKSTKMERVERARGKRTPMHTRTLTHIQTSLHAQRKLHLLHPHLLHPYLLANVYLQTHLLANASARSRAH